MSSPTPSLYTKRGIGPNGVETDVWYYSCCGKEVGPFDTKSLAEAAAALHKFSH